MRMSAATSGRFTWIGVMISGYHDTPSIMILVVSCIWYTDLEGMWFLLSLRRMGKITLTAVYMKVPEGYVTFVEELPGTNTQGATLDEARTNLEEAVSMVLEANRWLSKQALADASVTRESLILPAA
jgi:predicted RNase H-like HicB family nuclease